MKKLLPAIRRLIRTVRWAFYCLWLGKAVPRPKDPKPYAKGYLHKIYRPVLRELDRAFNESRDPRILLFRSLQVARRRAYKFPLEEED